MTAHDIALLVVIGLMAGLLAGTFGVGGGVLVVPALVLMLGFEQASASATSLLAIIPAAISGTISNHKRTIIRWPSVGLLACGGVVGALIGTQVAIRADAYWLRWAFIAYLIIVAYRLLIPLRRTP